jgi:hypothetical protein
MYKNAENITKHSSWQSRVPIPDVPTQDERMFNLYRSFSWRYKLLVVFSTAP